LDGFDKFVESGTARTMMRALEILWSGEQIDDATRCLTINLLHKAAYMLKDGRYIYLARKLGFDFDVFRIGQSFYPPASLKPTPPLDLVGKVLAQPLPKTRWKQTRLTFPLEQAFHFLSYRTGLEREDDYFMIDGFFGRGRNPYHVNPIYILRLKGRYVLKGFESQISVRRQGMVEPRVAYGAALKKSVALGGLAYVKTNVPDMPFSSWDRHLLYLPDGFVVVMDEVTARESGDFEITWRWAFLGSRKKFIPEKRAATSSMRGYICCDKPLPYMVEGRKLVRQKAEGYVEKGKSKTLMTLLSTTDVAGKVGCKAGFELEPIGRNACRIVGAANAVVSFGKLDSNAVQTDAEMTYLSPQWMFVVGGRRVAVSGKALIQSDQSVDLCWSLKDGKVEVAVAADASLKLAGKEFKLKAGRRTLDAAGDEALRETVAKAIASIKPVQVKQATAAPAAAPKPNWQPSLKLSVDGRVTHIAPARGGIYVATVCEKMAEQKSKKGAEPFSRLYLLDEELQPRKQIEYESEILSLRAATAGKEPKAFSVVAGFNDDTVRAISPNGDEVWNFRARIHPDFKVGDRYRAPWFSDPALHHGVFDIFIGDIWGDGREIIAVSRPCTVEFHKLDGNLIARMPIMWGDCTSIAALRKPGEGKEPWFLVGKFYTGLPGVSVINREYKKVSDGYYRRNAKGFTAMGAWMQRGLSHLIVSDIDGDDVEEVIIALSGHWNELKVYKGADWSTCRWMVSFGPARPRSRFMRAVVVADIAGDAKKEIAVGMENGWICAFDSSGKALWQKRLNAAVRSMCAAGRKLVAGCSDGTVCLLDGAGKVVRVASLGAEVTVLAPTRSGVLAGCADGKVTLLRVEETK